ncbi:MAG TPA: CdaR family protein [bacterium]|nr:CdaR family protein [bacterium]HOL47446.1 CdaR family protein [bacterium]HPQ19513.1 CdaR family protein [bacterium]
MSKKIFKFFKKIIFKNWYLKILALIFAILIWYYIIGSEIIEYTYSVPVNFINIPESFILKQTDDEIFVKLTIKGARANLLNKNLSDFKIDVDLSNVKIGLNTIPIKQHNITLPRGIELNYIEPHSIDVYIDKKISKSVKLEPPVFIGQPEKNIYIDTCYLSVTTKIIEGPASILKEIESLSLEPVNIENINQDIEKELNIILPDKSISIPGSSKVKIIIKVKKITDKLSSDTNVK